MAINIAMNNSKTIEAVSIKKKTLRIRSKGVANLR